MKAGIYQIRNLINGKLYIGSAVDFSMRWSKHRSDLTKRSHHSIYLQRAWNKHGADAFVFEVLLYCDPENCLFYEQVALDHYKPEYNICKIAGSSFGVKQSQATKDKRAITHRGMKRSIETRHKMSQSAKQRQIESFGFTGKQHTTQSKQKISIAKRGEKSWSSKLTEREVRIIKRALRVGIFQKKLATRFSVSSCTISAIKTGRKWGWV